ncbi:hypothetical protein TrVFT333_003148 [Trichoderma virens FT-333]|nr:hypothetical protein TrVFT333_003148 [Trichoderma virens FT-333]
MRHKINCTEMRLLDTIDSLRDLRIGDIVDLPQIVVVGDQCSGKRSVLKAISRVHFPIMELSDIEIPTLGKQYARVKAAVEAYWRQTTNMTVAD